MKRGSAPPFPSPSLNYDPHGEAQFRAAVERAITEALTADDMILQSPDGSHWRISVDNTGALATAKITR